MPDILVSNRAKFLAMRGLDLENDDIRALLVNETYVPSADHSVIADIVPATAEIQDASYSRQGLTGKSVTQDDTNNRGVFTAADLEYGSIIGGETAAGIIFFRRVTDDDDSDYLWFQRLNPPKTLNGGSVTLDVRPVGLLHVAETAAAGEAAEESEDPFGSQWGEVTLVDGEQDAILSEEIPGAEYDVVSLAGNADESFYWTDKTSTQFTIKSSTGASTATVGWEIRPRQEMS